MICSIVGGTGAMGAALALRLAQAGHEVRIGSRDHDRAAAKAAEVAGAAAGATVIGGKPDEVLPGAALVFVTVPYAAHGETMAQLAPLLAPDQIVIDATAPLRPPKVGTVQLPAAGSAALEARAALGPEARLVSALQTIGAAKLAAGGDVGCDVLVAADDGEAAASVIAVLADLGVRGWHVGPLANAAAAEAMTSILITINRRYKCAQSGIRIVGPVAA